MNSQSNETDTSSSVKCIKLTKISESPKSEQNGTVNEAFTGDAEQGTPTSGDVPNGDVTSDVNVTVDNEGHEFSYITFEQANGSKEPPDNSGTPQDNNSRSAGKHEKIVIEEVKQKPLIYSISENPPFYLTIMFALQSTLVIMNGKAKAECDSENSETTESLLQSDQTPPYSDTNKCNVPEDESSVVIEDEPRINLYYRIKDDPPVHLCLLFAIQQALLPVSTSLSVSLLVAELVCARDDDEIKAQLLSTTFLMAGIATLLMCTVGVRLPIFQGPSSSYVVPLIGLAALKEWSCPTKDDLVAMYSNSTSNTTELDLDGRLAVPRHIIYSQLEKLQGSLMVAGALHLLIGLTGLVGVIARFVGPITIVPSLMLAVLYMHRVAVKFSETYWGTAVSTTVCGIILSLYLAGKNTPIPWWKRGRGFHIMWYPLHQVFSILISVLFGWALSAILTNVGVLSEDPNSNQFYARTDARNEILSTNPWLFFPYPGQFGAYRFDTAAFVGAFVATIMSIVDSICDYNACARMCYVPFPPPHAMNRGIFWEGLMSFFAGMTGAGHGTNSYGGNIGAIGITKVASRRVFILLAFIYILFAILGKLNAAFITIPYSVLGGTMILYFGIFVGIVLSQLQFIDLNCTRNLAILGISILVGYMAPYWVEKNPDAIQTGVPTVDRTLTMLAANGIFVAGVVSCFLDNTVKGSIESRGLIAQLEGEEASDKHKVEYEEGEEVYDLPWVPNFIKTSRFAKYCPILPDYSKTKPTAKEK